jgi:hypothetical protein
MKKLKSTRTAAKKIPHAKAVFYGAHVTRAEFDEKLEKVGTALGQLLLLIENGRESMEVIRKVLHVLVLERNARHDAHYPTSKKTSAKRTRKA